LDYTLHFRSPSTAIPPIAYTHATYTIQMSAQNKSVDVL